MNVPFLPGPFTIAVIFVVILFLSKWINILNEYERAVTFWLGRLGVAPKGPGLTFIFWPFEKMVRVDLRTVTLEVPPQYDITKDNVSVKVNAVVYFHVMDAARAIVKVANYFVATQQLALTTLRSVLGQATLDELLSEREKLNLSLQEILDRPTEPWGIKVTIVDVENFLFATSQLSQTTLRSILGQSQLDELLAEREKINLELQKIITTR